MNTLPSDITDYIFSLKHKLELVDVLSEMNSKFNGLINLVKESRQFERSTRFVQISDTEYLKRRTLFDKSIFGKFYRPLRMLRDILPHYAYTIDDYLEKNFQFRTVAYSRFTMSSIKKKSELFALCDDNGIQYTSRDTKKILYKKLMSV